MQAERDLAAATTRADIAETDRTATQTLATATAEQLHAAQTELALARQQAEPRAPTGSSRPRGTR
jgi:hypothetical protein